MFSIANNYVMWGKKISMILSIVTDFSHGNVNNFKTCFSLAFMKLCIRILDHYLCQSVFDKIRLRIEREITYKVLSFDGLGISLIRLCIIILPEF